MYRVGCTYCLQLGGDCSVFGMALKVFINILSLMWAPIRMECIAITVMLENKRRLKTRSAAAFWISYGGWMAASCSNVFCCPNVTR